VLFGSDTHSEDWTNSPLFFDLASLSRTSGWNPRASDRRTTLHAKQGVRRVLLHGAAADPRESAQREHASSDRAQP
jgi:hypothetical protein